MTLWGLVDCEPDPPREVTQSSIEGWRLKQLLFVEQADDVD